MTFAVFGVNKVKCRDAAFKFIASSESKSRAVIKREIDHFGGELGLHFENIINSIVCPDQYELALKEHTKTLCSAAKWSAISPKYDSPAAAIEYLEMLNAGGDKGCIKQQVIVTDAEGKPVYGKRAKTPKKEWLLFDRSAMRAIRK